MTEPDARLRVEVLTFAGCPHAAAAVALVRRCAERLGLEIDLVERDAPGASPRILVEGRDVSGETETEARACRLEVPAEDAVMAALGSAMEGRLP